MLFIFIFRCESRSEYKIPPINFDSEDELTVRCNIRKSVGYLSNALFIVRNLIKKKNNSINSKDKNINLDTKENISLKEDNTNINSIPEWNYLHNNDTKPVNSNSVSNYLVKLEETILVKLSYVHLCLNNTQTTLMISKDLVNNPLRNNLNEQIKILGEIYYLESLCANGYITDALTTILKQDSNVSNKNNNYSDILKGCVFSKNMYISTNNNSNNINADVILMINKASVLSLDGQLDLAYEILNNALKIQPNFVPIIRGLVYIYLRKGEIDPALKLLKLHSKGFIRTKIQYGNTQLDNKINKN
jgi:tetratricopeptide (TPR) repeat protein